MKHLICLTLSFFLLGCYTITSIPGTQPTSNNFKIIKPHASVDLYGFRLFGIFPFVRPSRAKAEEEILASVGPVEGRPIALINKVEERSAIYLVLFSIPRLTVTADVIEFVDP